MSVSERPMSARRLRVMFQSVLVAALGPAACTRISPSDFTANACVAGRLDGLDRVTPGTPVDYMELRSVPDGATSGDFAVSRRGVACATATDAAACNAALNQLRPLAGWASGGPGTAPMHNYLIFTRGDTVTAITTREALGAFLSPIESPADAALLVAERGFNIRCESNNVRAVAGGFEVLGYSGFSCGAGTHTDANVISVTTAGTAQVIDTEVESYGSSNCVVGRLPEGLCIRKGAVADEASSASPDTARVGAYLSHMASLEAAAVFAFERLARELAAHGAPRHLVRRARRAADDERRHAVTTRALADRYGGARLRIAVARREVRPLADIARENAVEGCVRETFGALQATLQARRAADPAVATAMRQIALDETRHAALSWAVAAWIEPKLDAPTRAAVERARREAMAKLAVDVRTAPADAVVAATGAPTADEGVAMHRAMVAEGAWARVAA